LQSPSEELGNKLSVQKEEHGNIIKQNGED
jgi:hypothetical protein